MDFTSLLAFAMALFVAAAAPGPGIAAIVARVLGRGAHGAIAFAIALAVGDVLWLTASIVGLAILAQTFHAIFVAAKWVGITYLLYIAWEMWTAPAPPTSVADELPNERSAAPFAAGLALSIGNPKVMLFYLALLPTILDLARVTVLGYVELVAVTLAVLSIVLGSYIALAARARLFFTSPRAMNVLNRGSAGAMAGAATWLAIK